jgi:ferric-dicitrate binding protein FerR (iron transport regulator)
MKQRKIKKYLHTSITVSDSDKEGADSSPDQEAEIVLWAEASDEHHCAFEHVRLLTICKDLKNHLQEAEATEAILQVESGLGILPPGDEQHKENVQSFGGDVVSVFKASFRKWSLRTHGARCKAEALAAHSLKSEPLEKGAAPARWSVITGSFGKLPDLRARTGRRRSLRMSDSSWRTLSSLH